MARFDLYRVAAWPIPLMVDVQAAILEDIASRVVIPLRPVGETEEATLPKLKPVLAIGADNYVLITTDIGAQPLHWLGKPVGNIDAHRDTIVAAIDFLFQGY